MCYLVAKDVDAVGCVALKTTHGKHLSEFKKKIMDKVVIVFSWLRSADRLPMENTNHTILWKQRKNLKKW